MQGDGGLAGARSAGHDQRPVVRGPYGLVLLALDGGDDVAHLAGALPADGGQEGAVADDDGAVQPVLGSGVQQLVVDADHAVTAARDRPATHHALRVGGGRPVERRRGRGPPVDDDRLLAVGAQAGAADVQDGRVVAVEPPEQQTLPGEVQVGASVRGGLGGDVALVDGLRRAPDGSQALALAHRGLAAQHFEAGQRPVQHDLLALHLVRERARGGGGCGGHRDSLPRSRTGITRCG